MVFQFVFFFTGTGSFHSSFCLQCCNEFASCSHQALCLQDAWYHSCGLSFTFLLKFFSGKFSFSKHSLTWSLLICIKSCMYIFAYLYAHIYLRIFKHLWPNQRFVHWVWAICFVSCIYFVKNKIFSWWRSRGRIFLLGIFENNFHSKDYFDFPFLNLNRPPWKL